MNENAYDTWKQHIPQLYDFIFIYELDSPSLSVEWSNHIDKNLLGTQSQKIVLGTDYTVTPSNTNNKKQPAKKDVVEDEQNYLQILQVSLLLIFFLFMFYSYSNNPISNLETNSGASIVKGNSDIIFLLENITFITIVIITIILLLIVLDQYKSTFNRK